MDRTCEIRTSNLPILLLLFLGLLLLPANDQYAVCHRKVTHDIPLPARKLTRSVQRGQASLFASRNIGVSGNRLLTLFLLPIFALVLLRRRLLGLLQFLSLSARELSLLSCSLFFGFL